MKKEILGILLPALGLCYCLLRVTHSSACSTIVLDIIFKVVSLPDHQCQIVDIMTELYIAGEY